LRTKSLLYNARVHTQAENLIVDSLAVYKNRIVAVGNRLEHDPDFKSYRKINLRGRMVIPGLVDGHTQFYYWAKALGHVDLDGLDSIDKALNRIKKHALQSGKKDWVVADGFSPDRLKKRAEFDRYMLDRVTGDRPAFIFSKDQHTVWVNSRALKLAGIDKNTPDPEGGVIDRFDDGTPSGILRENPAYNPVYKRIASVSKKEMTRRFEIALEIAYRKGVTGVHSFDGPEAFTFF
jgi:predicted amidohydrolase YtcJ